MGNSSGPGADVYGEYDIPESVGQGETGAEDARPGDDGGAEGDRSAAADDGQSDEGAGPPPRRVPGSGAGAGGDQGGKPAEIPMHRYEALEQRVERLTAGYESRVRQLENENRRFRHALGVGEAAPRPRTYNAREQRLRSQIFNLMPELGVLSDEKLHRLLARATDLDRMAQEFPQTSEAETRRWGGHAERMVRQVLNHAATQWLGTGKTLKDLEDIDRRELDRAFVDWVSWKARLEEQELPAGYFGETTLRYEAGDPALVTEFWTHFTRRHGGAAAGVQGERRSAGVAAAARAAAAGRAPRGGSSSGPVGSAGRQIETPTLDAALDEGWSFVQNQRAGAGA